MHTLQIAENSFCSIFYFLFYADHLRRERGGVVVERRTPNRCYKTLNDYKMSDLVVH